LMVSLVVTSPLLVPNYAGEPTDRGEAQFTQEGFGRKRFFSMLS